MIDNVEELKEKALDNKPEIKSQKINLTIGETSYPFIISGIGNKAIKIEKYINYEDIIEAVSQGNNTGLEYILKTLIENFEKEE